MNYYCVMQGRSTSVRLRAVLVSVLLLQIACPGRAFAPSSRVTTGWDCTAASVAKRAPGGGTTVHRMTRRARSPSDDSRNAESNRSLLPSSVSSFAAAVVLAVLCVFGGGIGDAALATTSASYDGFAEYARENRMEKSDVGCFLNKCGPQTKSLFANPRGIKGISCLGRCKGEQICSTKCFAEFGSDDLTSFLSCAIVDNSCVKIPGGGGDTKNGATTSFFDNSAEDVGYESTVRKFDPAHLVGTWYKTDGNNPNYDLYDCQKTTFAIPSTKKGDDAATESSSDNNAAASSSLPDLTMSVSLRVPRPKNGEGGGGGFWENAVTESVFVDAIKPDYKKGDRTMHTQGKSFGLPFYENYWVLGESDGGEIPPFVLIAYKGHTLQGNYEGSFVYAKEPVLPARAVPAVRDAAEKAGLDWDGYKRIDNTCPAAGSAPNDAAETGTGGTSTRDWIDLVVGEGGVIDWISPGWRGEYKK